MLNVWNSGKNKVPMRVAPKIGNMIFFSWILIQCNKINFLSKLQGWLDDLLVISTPGEQRKNYLSVLALYSMVVIHAFFVTLRISEVILSSFCCDSTFSFFKQPLTIKENLHLLCFVFLWIHALSPSSVFFVSFS